MSPGGHAVSKRWLVALPVAFLIHDLEELISVKEWMRTHGSAVPAVIRSHVPQDNTTLLIAFAILFVVYLMSVIAVWQWPSSKLAGWVLALLVMARLTNGFAHMAQGVVFMGYTPGLITAVAVEIPIAIWGIRTLEGLEVIRRRELVPLFLGGWIIQIVGIAAVVAISTEMVR